MKNLKTTSIYFIVSLVIVLSIMVLSSCQSNESTALVSSNAASLGQILTFTEGYYLVSVAAYNTDSSIKMMYVCQSDQDPKIYRVCIPKTG